VYQVFQELIAKAKAREGKRTTRELREDKHAAVVMLLQHLSFLEEDDGYISAATMREFRKQQRSSLFFGANVWPSRLEDQINHLYNRLDEAWEHSSK
jgi:hypothetical protein